MTVHLFKDKTRPKTRQAAESAAQVNQMFQLLCDWNFDARVLDARLAQVTDGVGFATLFKDIVCHDPKARSQWFASPNARQALTHAIENCDIAWDHHLAYSPERLAEARDYICQALARFKDQTSP